MKLSFDKSKISEKPNKGQLVAAVLMAGSTWAELAFSEWLARTPEAVDGAYNMLPLNRYCGGWIKFGEAWPDIVRRHKEDPRAVRDEILERYEEFCGEPPPSYTCSLETIETYIEAWRQFQTLI